MNCVKKGYVSNVYKKKNIWSFREQKPTSYAYFKVEKNLSLAMSFFYNEVHVIYLIWVWKKVLCWNPYRILTSPSDKLLYGQFCLSISLYLIYINFSLSVLKRLLQVVDYHMFWKEMWGVGSLLQVIN